MPDTHVATEPRELLVSACPVPGQRCASPCLAFPRALDPTSGVHAYTASTLPAEPSAQLSPTVDLYCTTRMPYTLCSFITLFLLMASSVKTEWQGGWREGSAARITCRSSREPWFSSQHPQVNSQPCITPVPGTGCPILAPTGNCTYVYIPTDTYTQWKINLLKMLKLNDMQKM